MNQFKLWVVYGEMGSSVLFGLLFMMLVFINIGGQVGICVGGSFGNLNLEFEIFQELEFGVDFGILNNKLNFGVIYYICDVENLFYDFDILFFIGWVDESWSDFDFCNQGLEVQLGFILVNCEKFQWNFIVNYWYNCLEVICLGVLLFVLIGVVFGLGLGIFFVEEGEFIIQLKGNGVEGFVIIGDVEFDFQLGWFNQIKIGNNIDFIFLIYWKEGGDVFNLFCLLINFGGIIFEEYVDLVGFVEDVFYFCLCEVGLYYILFKFSNIISCLCVGVFGCNLFILIDYSSYDLEVFIKGIIGLLMGIEVMFFLSMCQVYFYVIVEF